MKISLENLAGICHQANKSYCESMGDLSHKDWNETPKEIQDSVINGVEFYLVNQTATPESSHSNWIRYKEREGWRCGEFKDLAKKTHPSLKPFDELSIAEQTKDRLFCAIVKVFS